jgi:ubiquinone/menaquinone biosynthesis C-methylase UbiE
MLPKTEEQEYEHRRHKRELEAELIIGAMEAYLERNPQTGGTATIQILEIGAGDGFQVSYLRKLGNVIASDIYTSKGIQNQKPLDFLECSISHAPFKTGKFDIVFANQVIPSLTDIPGSLREVQRIGKAGCLYAFSVPTATWLLLSVPALYYNKLRYGVQTYVHDSRLKTLLRRLLPEGRARWNFLQCYHHYKLKNWRQLFLQYGFSILEAKPLLLYGPSEWPIIPTSAPTASFCSSVLFLLKKRGVN